MQKITKKSKIKVIFRFATAIAFVLALGAFAVSAKDYYKVNDYQTELVDECGDCTYVENNNCLEDALFVPTRTCSEWNKFRYYHPSCADLEESYHDDQKCYNNDVWWYNACGDRQDKKEDCGYSYCDTGGYPEGTGDVDEYCSGGDVWGRYDYYNAGCSGASCYSDWDYNSCGNEKLEDCGSNYCTSWSGWSCSGSSTRERTRTCYNKGCSNGSCYSSSYTDTETENCPSGQECSGGVCVSTCDPNTCTGYTCTSWDLVSGPGPSGTYGTNIYEREVCKKYCSGGDCVDECYTQECKQDWTEHSGGWGGCYPDSNCNSIDFENAKFWSD
ncbi:MAG: hypothetical protein ACOCUF_03900 [Patescibacteria group bacterium]